MYREDIGVAVQQGAEKVIFDIKECVAQNNHGLCFDDTPHGVAVAELLFADFLPVEPGIYVGVRPYFVVEGIMLIKCGNASVVTEEIIGRKTEDVMECCKQNEEGKKAEVILRGEVVSVVEERDKRGYDGQQKRDVELRTSIRCD